MATRALRAALAYWKEHVSGVFGVYKALSSPSFYAAAINPFAVVTVFIPLSET